ncbi:MAG: hypothetical protein RL693_1287 [Verrucomicrobiota bacterium]|jgi:predicted transcriptional regulator
MKPVPNRILSLLLFALCGLLAWQWARESKLRLLLNNKVTESNQYASQREELESRVKAADAELLRISGSLGELRSNSVSKEIHTEAQEANTALRDTAIRQNAAITQQNEFINKQNDGVQKANDNIRKLTTERDELAKRLNDVTAKYNELIKKS